MMFRIGVDVGGTYTDLVATDESGRTVFAKSPSTPADQSLGVMAGLDDLARHLTGFLEEVPDAPPPIAAAMRIAGTKAGRAALGAAAAGGVKHMAHRFIVGGSAPPRGTQHRLKARPRARAQPPRSPAADR